MARPSDQTLLDQLIHQRTGEAMAAMLSAAAYKFAEDIAKEALADEEFRKSFLTAVRQQAAAWMERLTAPPPPEKPNGSRRR